MKPTVKVRVWDLPTRLFHWLLVILFIVMWVTGEQGGDWLQYHIKCGIAIAVMLVFRVVWGFVGSQTSRFSDFVKKPVEIWGYIRGRRAGNSITGHNPLGGLMVVGLLLALLVQVSTGLFSTDVDSYLFNGPLADRIASDLSEAITSFHKAFFNVLLALVSVHVLAILVYWLFRQENLVLPMLTGYKEMGEDVPTPRLLPVLFALVVLLLACGGLYLVLTHF